MHVSVNRETCTVSSLCVYRAPEVFDQDDDGRVVLLDPDPPVETADAVRNAVRSCPTRSIRVSEQGGAS